MEDILSYRRLDFDCELIDSVDWQDEILEKPKAPTNLLETSFLGYLAGTLTSYLLHFGLKFHDDVTTNLSAPDNLLNAAAVVIPYVAIKSTAKRLISHENRVIRWTGKKFEKYAGLLATIPALVYEVVETITGKGIHPQSVPTPLGTLKDVISYAVTGATLYYLDNYTPSKSTDDLPPPVLVNYDALPI